MTDDAERLSQLAYLRKHHPAAFILVANGWTVDSALSHIEGTCDHAICTGSHGSHDGRHDADGQPYIAYFNAGVMVGFIWDGDPDSLVQVQREMGEPIIAEFPMSGLSGGGAPIPYQQMLRLFRDACDQWLFDNAGLF